MVYLVGGDLTMPLDTRITIKIEALGTRDGTGEYTHGPITDYPLWCDEMKSRDDDHLEDAGARTIQIRHFRVRYFRALAVANIALVSLVDSLGLTWNPDSVDLSDERKRFILVRCVREITSPANGGMTNGGGGGGGGGIAPVDSLALAPTEQSGIRRFARTMNQVAVSDFYAGGFPKRMIATFVNDEVIRNVNNGPRSAWSDDTALSEGERNDSGGPVTSGFDGRTFDAPATMPSDAMAFFFVYWIDRSSDGSPEPDTLISIAFV